MATVLEWSSHLDPADGVVWDVSPGALGDLRLPPPGADTRAFYAAAGRGEIGGGHAVNPPHRAALRSQPRLAGRLHPGARRVLGRRPRLRDPARPLVHHRQRRRRPPRPGPEVEGGGADPGPVGVGRQALPRPRRRRPRRRGRGVGAQGALRHRPPDLGDPRARGAGAEHGAGRRRLPPGRAAAGARPCRAHRLGRPPGGVPGRVGRRPQGARVARPDRRARPRDRRGRRGLGPSRRVVALPAPHVRLAALRGLRVGSLHVLARRRRGAHARHRRPLLPRRARGVPGAARHVPGVRGRTLRRRRAAVGHLPRRRRPVQPVSDLGRHPPALR